MIPITKPFLPPIEEYSKLLKEVWANGWLTNMGPLSIQLEEELKAHLKLKNLLFVTNGTIAIQMAIKALELTGEIITTPFSFVATTSSIVWEGCTPVFVDIDLDTLNIDANKIEEAITDKTSAILATHVYGNPCDVEEIERIANKYNLKVIYDAAHAFGVELNGKSIFEYGNVSTLSMHATKLFHTIEGGLVITNDDNLNKKLKYIRNFGISGFDSFAELGINGKNSEFHATMGLVNLKYIDEIKEKRALLAETYNDNLKGSNLKFPKWHKESNNNNAYYPVIFPDEDTLLKVVDTFNKNNIGSRRYFYPSLATALPYIKPKSLPITDEISKRVLCLPFYYDLLFEELNKICKILLQIHNN